MADDQLADVVTEQLSLPDVKSPAPMATADDVAAVIGVLRLGKGWMTAKEIAVALNRPPTEAQERKIRAVAGVAMPEIVSYPGSPGYKLWGACSVEEINHCIDAFERQGRDMLKRAVLYQRAYHSRHRTPVVPAVQEALAFA